MNYGIHDKDLLVIVESMDRWKKYLGGGSRMSRNAHSILSPQRCKTHGKFAGHNKPIST